MSFSRAKTRTKPANKQVFTHEQLVRRHTGLGADVASWLHGDKAKALLLEQTNHLADRLEACEIQARLPQTLTAISAVTMIADQLESFRPIRILPTVASRDRRPHLNGLEYWIDQNPQARRFMRYAVITFGEPIKVGGPLREAISELTKRISRWASDIKKRYQIEVIYRGIEYTRDRRGDDEEYTYHLHANVLYWPHIKLHDDVWSEFLSFTWKRIKAHWKDNQRIENLKEIVKYVIKPEDLQNIDDDELVWLYHSTFKKQISAPMGCFREYMAQLRKDRKKVVQVDGVGLSESSKAQKLSRKIKPKTDENSAESGTSSGKVKNLILGITLPQRRHSPWAEPMILVQNYEPNAVGTAAENFRQELAALHMEALIFWQENGAPDPRTALEVAKTARAGAENVEALSESRRSKKYRVHNSSVTAQTSISGLDPANDAAAKIDTLTEIGPLRKFRSSGNGPPSAS